MFALETTRDQFVSIDETFISWALLLGIIVLLIAIDLYRHRDDHAPSPREALIESLVWIVIGFIFGGYVAWEFGAGAFGEYTSGYLIERSLSIDNVFVWSIVFSTLGIPLKFQHRVLFWGIFGALVLRAAFIGGGTALVTRFEWVMIVFGVFLVYTGIRVYRHRAEEGEGAARTMNLVRRLMPVTAEYDGHRFLTKVKGRRAATPLLAALVVVELTDVVFAVDSVPAILAVSHEPYLVFASNAFAILGLRAMYFLLATARGRFHYLSHGLGAVLVFVGIKMSIAQWVHIDTYLSLGVITAVLTAAIVFSERKTRRHRRKSGSIDTDGV
ncbi:MAG: TerC family protein [Actinomycetota bacterium]